MSRLSAVGLGGRYSLVPIVPLYGHDALRERLSAAADRGALPSSLLFHGPRGVGKQRLALWLAQRLLCATAEAPRPCGECQSCRYVLELSHPDLHWFFPRPRIKDTDADADEIRADYIDATLERLERHGLYAAPPGTDALYLATIRALLRRAVMAPAFGRRRVFIVGDAERMVPQEGADMAANAFLKLLEEPPADTVIILTSSEPGALLPTIRSRVICIRVPRMPDSDVASFVSDPIVAAALDDEGVPAGMSERVRLAAGAPGTLLGGASRDEAAAVARRLFDAAVADRPEVRYRHALAQGSTKARGTFSEALGELTTLLHRQVATAVDGSDEQRAVSASRVVESIERAKELAYGNVNPQLVSAWLLNDLREHLR